MAKIYFSKLRYYHNSSKNRKWRKLQTNPLGHQSSINKTKLQALKLLKTEKIHHQTAAAFEKPYQQNKCLTMTTFLLAG